jgi:hypothetical protein
MRASRATVVGIVVFAVGTAATFLLLRRDSGSTVTVGRGQAGVLVAVNQIPAGTTERTRSPAGWWRRAPFATATGRRLP